jgi:hypothetical protein
MGLARSVMQGWQFRSKVRQSSAGSRVRYPRQLPLKIQRIRSCAPKLYPLYPYHHAREPHRNHIAPGTFKHSGTFIELSRKSQLGARVAFAVSLTAGSAKFPVVWGQKWVARKQPFIFGALPSGHLAIPDQALTIIRYLFSFAGPSRSQKLA